MTRSIEHSRRHGPFDRRHIDARARLARLDAAHAAHAAGDGPAEAAAEAVAAATPAPHQPGRIL
jgi:hypothetical protein